MRESTALVQTEPTSSIDCERTHFRMCIWGQAWWEFGVLEISHWWMHKHGFLKNAEMGSWSLSPGGSSKWLASVPPSRGSNIISKSTRAKDKSNHKMSLGARSSSHQGRTCNVVAGGGGWLHRHAITWGKFSPRVCADACCQLSGPSSSDLLLPWHTAARMAPCLVWWAERL